MKLSSWRIPSLFANSVGGLSLFQNITCHSRSLHKFSCFFLLNTIGKRITDMDVLGKMIGIRLFVILLLTFILMRIFYIYFYQYLELKYIHFPQIPGLEKKSSTSSPTSDLISSSMNAQYGRNASYHALRKSPKYNFFNPNNSRINWQRNSSFVGSNRKKSSRISKKPLYEDWENRLKRQEVSWEDFVNFPRLPPRSKQNIPVTAMASLRRCEERKNDNSYNSTSITKKGCNDVRILLFS